MDSLNYSVIKHPLNPRKTVSGSVGLARPLLTTEHLFAHLTDTGVIKGQPEWFVIRSAQMGKIEDWSSPLLPNDQVTFCPKVQGPLVAFLPFLGIFFFAAQIGYSIYSYVDMQNSLGDMQSGDPTKRDAAGSQAYSFTGMDNYRIDGAPIPVLYGTTKVGGVILNECFFGPVGGENERYKVLLGLCWGTVVGINSSEDILLDDVRLTEYSKYSHTIRTGTKTQAAVAGFEELWQQHYPETAHVNPTVHYFPFDNAYTDMSECRNPSDETVEGIPFVDSLSSFSSGTKAIGTHSVRLTATGPHVRWGGTTLETGAWRFFDPRSDPFSIRNHMRFNNIDWTNMATNGRHYTIWSQGNVDNAEGNAWWDCGLKRIDASTFVMYLRAKWAKSSGPTWDTSVYFQSIPLTGTSEDDAWHYIEWCRDGEYVKILWDGEDITDEAETVFGEQPDVYCLTVAGGWKRLYLGASTGSVNGGTSMYGFRGFIDDAVFEQNGTIPISNYTPPTTAYDIDEQGTVEVPRRGMADKLMWQYRLPKGLIWAHSTKTRKESIFFQEQVEFSGWTAYAHCPTAAYDADYSPWVREAVGHNQSLLLRHYEFAFDYIRLGALSGDIVIGEKLTASGGGTGIVCGFYRATSSNNYIYLLNATGTFSGTASAPSLTSASILAGLTTATSFENWQSKRVSPTCQNSHHSSLAELKSFTEVRRLELNYPWLAYLALELEAQKGLTRKPKINVIIQGAVTKTLYRWNGTACVSFTGTMTNPAHVAWDQMTDGFYDGSTRRGLGYGLGIHPRRMDYNAWANMSDSDSWAYYCNANVAVIGGGTQPRCKINIVFDEKDRTAWDCIQDAALVGRGRIISTGNTWTVKINRPANPVMTVTAAMIIEDSYEEEYINDGSKYDELNLEFLNEENYYMKDSVGYAIEDWDNISINEIFKSETVFVKGITNRNFARREAILRVQQTQSLKKRHTWRMDIDAINFEIGDVLKLQHDSHKYGYGGLIAEQAGTTIFLGKTVMLSGAMYAGSAPVLAYRSNNDDTWNQCVVTGPWDQETDYVTVTDAKTIAAGDPWALGRDTTQGNEADLELVRIEEMEIDEEQKVSIVAFNYDESVYYHADYDSGTDII